MIQVKIILVAVVLAIMSTVCVTAQGMSWQEIDRKYAYAGDDLGCIYHADGSADIKLWAPLATEVKLFLFDRDDQTRKLQTIPMIRQDRGVWHLRLEAGEYDIPDFLGYFYQFEVHNPGREPKVVLDPYARSMAVVTVDTAGQNAGATGDFVGKAAILDPSRIGPKVGRPVIKGYQKREDAIIWETHIRDFTSDPSIEGDLKARWGGYRAFIDKLPYIKSLGVTHVQLLPVNAWYWGDETKMGQRELGFSSKNNQYNWGYDPHNYFSLDGAYSEKPEDPQLRVAEFKQLVNAIHKAGMGVILDVVYTHMAKADFLNDIVPNYYFFMNPEGHFIGGFGNNLATNRKMAEKLMIDSVEFWFREYGIDGMRWDMMGDATHESIQRAFDAAARINPKALFIGEGWRTFGGHLEDPSLAGKAADQDWMDETNDVGVFSDEFRNELKSGFGIEGQPRFLTGGKRPIELIFRNIKAQPTNTPADAPGDMVQYIASHDNLPLFDVIAKSIMKDPDIPDNFLEIHRRMRLGNAMLLTSQGTVFLHAGQEYGITKQWRAPGKPEHKYHKMTDKAGKPFKYPYVVHDSFDSSDAINMFDWKRAVRGEKPVAEFAVNHQTVDYTRGLIALRHSTDAFRLPTKQVVDKNVTLIKAPEIEKEDLVIAWRSVSTDGDVYYVFVNADMKERNLSIEVDLTGCDILVDREQSGTKPISSPVGVSFTASSIKLAPLTAAVFKQK